jgi:glycosyltransferase involved in cell wall biosynthesis
VILKEKWNCNAEPIPFWIERDIYYPVRERKSHCLIFFSRPEMPRRCFYLGVAALEIYHKRNPDVDLVIYGSDLTKTHKIPFKHIDRGILSKKELALLYSEATLGFAISTTNPSFVAYEMMACGCPVLDLRIDSHYDYLKYGSENNAVLVDPDPVRIAQAIEDLMANTDFRNQVAKNGHQYVRSFPDVHGSARHFENILLKRVNESG